MISLADNKRIIIAAERKAELIGQPREIAEAVLFFLKSTRFITGQVVAVDGGLSQK